MSQYVIQIRISDGWLAKYFKVTDEYPIPTEIPSGRIQVIMTNTTSYNDIVTTYNQYTTSLIFVENIPNIDCSGAVTDSWPID